MSDITDSMLQASFETAEGGGRRDRQQRDDAAAIKTYRYLRLGMIVIVIGLLASVFIQHKNAGCWQGSLSAYYYTPARPIFVSALLAIGVALMMIKGSTPVEDGLLIVAGALAPVVAFVPTSFEAPCDAPDQTQASGLPSSIVHDVQNNIGSLLIAGFVALLVAVLVLLLEQVYDKKVATDRLGWRFAILGLTAGLLGVGVWALATERILDWHGWAAVVMFAVLAVASIFNGAWLIWTNSRSDEKTSPRWQWFAGLYIAVGVLMLVGGVVIKFVIPDPWEHRTLILELVEITLFAAMWIVQSIERWGKILQPPAQDANPPPTFEPAS